MFSKIEPLPLESKDPWKGDLFQRDKFADSLAALLKSSSRSSVIGINAPYGFGKTFFLERFREQMKNDNAWVVYVNAWEYDYFESPLLALLDALKLAAGEVSTGKDLTKALTEIAKAAAPAVARAAGKRLVETALGVEGAKEISEVVGDASGRASERLIEQFAKQDTTHRMLGILRERIRAFISHHIGDQSSYKNLLVIVDELDRARPDFSIRFLETIKHVFGLSQVIFLISCDRSALVAAAKHEYGPNLESDGYLRRLFDYWIDLPVPSPGKYVLSCVQRLNLIADRVFVSNGDNVTDSDRLYAEFLLLGQSSDSISLRFIEQSVAHAGVVLRLAPVDKQAGLIGWIQNLKHFSPEKYQWYVSNERISEIYQQMAGYPPFHHARPFLKAFIILWAVNRKEEALDHLLGRFLGEASEAYSIARRIIADSHMDFDRESAAARIDRRMRTVSLHV